jgi:S1-C subfamily serine protease
MVFFIDADEKVYARYGGRDSKNADNRQSLDGLYYTMKSVLAMHERPKKEYAPKLQETSKYVRDFGGGMRRGCMHCHQVKEAINGSLNRSGKWSLDEVWKYPLPENLGFALEIDRGNVVQEVRDKMPASVAGLKVGDVVERLNGVPIHSFGDAQFALDRAPATGTIAVAFRRGDKVLEEKLILPEGWRKTDISWRPSMRFLVASARLGGDDLTAEERKTLGLSDKQLAFHQKENVHSQAKAAGIRGGDIILGLDDKPFEMSELQFQRYVRSHYAVGEKVVINLIRDGKRMNLSMTLVR